MRQNKWWKTHSSLDLFCRVLFINVLIYCTGSEQLYIFTCLCIRQTHKKYPAILNDYLCNDLCDLYISHELDMEYKSLIVCVHFHFHTGPWQREHPGVAEYSPGGWRVAIDLLSAAGGKERRGGEKLRSGEKGAGGKERNGRQTFIKCVRLYL